MLTTPLDHCAAIAGVYELLERVERWVVPPRPAHSSDLSTVDRQDSNDEPWSSANMTPRSAPRIGLEVQRAVLVADPQVEHRDMAAASSGYF
jgi:hypothetical protein